MTDTLPPPAPPPVQSESKGRSCWIVGCSGCLIALLVLVLLGFAGMWWLRKTFMVEPFDPIEISETEAAAADAKLKSLNLLNEQGQISDEFEMPPEGLRLTESEVNYWISKQDPEIADAVRLDFEPGLIRGEFRWGEPGSQQRWNLSGTISVEQKEDELDIRLLDLRMGGFALPDSVMKEIGAENLAAEAFADPETKKDFQEKVEKIEILKDEILLIPKK
jgi:hypothetical protein